MRDPQHKRLQRTAPTGKHLVRTALPVLELATTSSKGGELLGFNVRIVNWQPWYSVYHEHEYETSNFYDGPDFARGVRMYSDVLLAFNGVKKAEEFNKQIGLIMKKIEGFVAPYQHGAVNENVYVKEIMPRFLGYQDL